MHFSPPGGCRRRRAWPGCSGSTPTSSCRTTCGGSSRSWRPARSRAPRPARACCGMSQPGPAARDEAVSTRSRGRSDEGQLLDGKHSLSVEDVPDPEILNPRDAIVRITSTAICGSDLHLYNGFIPTMEKGDILGHEFMGEVVEVGHGGEEPEGRRPRGGAVPDRLRQLRHLPARAASRCARTPTRTPGWPRSCGATRRPASSATRTCSAATPAGRPSTRACRSPTSARSRSRTSCTDEQVLFLSDIFPTGYMARRDLRHPAGRRDRGLGLRPGRPVRHRERLPARRRAGDRHRPLPVPPAAWRARRPARRDDQLRRGGRLRGARGDDRRPRARRLHRRGRAWRRTAHGPVVRLRPRQAGDDAGDRPAASRCARRSWPAATAARSRSSASTAASSTSSRWARSMNRSLTIRTGQTPRAALHAAAARAHREGRDRPELRHHPPHAPRRTRPTATTSSCNKQDDCMKVVLKP